MVWVRAGETLHDAALQDMTPFLFPFMRVSTSEFKNVNVKSGQFVLVPKPQPGDIILWGGHMAIYDPEPGKTCGCSESEDADMWTAFRSGGPKYDAFSVKKWRKDKPEYYRYNSPDSGPQHSVGAPQPESLTRRFLNWLLNR